MPGYQQITQVRTQSRSSATYRSAGGDNASVGLSRQGVEITAVQHAALWDSVDEITNAGALERRLTNSNGIATKNVVAYDEAHSSVATKAVFVFQNDDGETETLAIPAPDQGIFNSDGVGVNPTAEGVPEVIAAALAILNAGAPAGTFGFLRGYRTGYSQRLRKPREGEIAVEPITDEPPA